MMAMRRLEEGDGWACGECKPGFGSPGVGGGTTPVKWGTAGRSAALGRRVPTGGIAGASRRWGLQAC